MKRFSPDQLQLTLDLHDHLEDHRYNINLMNDRKRRFMCELWVAKARLLLEHDLCEPDQNACLWVLGVVRAIARDHHMFILGVGRSQTDNWGHRLRNASAGLRPAAPKAKPATKAKVAKAASSAPSLPDLPNLADHTIVVVGGAVDPLVMHRYRDANFLLDWIPGNVRQVQAAVTRIGLGHLGGVVFLTDCNRHASFDAVRGACRTSATPMVLGTKGMTAMGRALQKLDEQLTRRSA